jgi:hypothetical protein
VPVALRISGAPMTRRRVDEFSGCHHPPARVRHLGAWWYFTGRRGYAAAQAGLASAVVAQYEHEASGATIWCDEHDGYSLLPEVSE